MKCSWEAAFSFISLSRRFWANARGVRVGWATVVSRRDQLQPWEVRAVTGSVAGQEPIAGDRGVGADVEVRERRALLPATAPVLEEALAGKEGGFVREVRFCETRFRDSRARPDPGSDRNCTNL